MIDRLGGNFSRSSVPAIETLPAGTKALVQESLRGLDPLKIHDYHVHVLALGTDVKGAYVNQAMTRWTSPVRHFKFLIYQSAVGIEDLKQADTQFRDQLFRLSDALPMPMVLHLLAFDKNYGRGGRVDEAKTEFYTPNAYVFQLAKEHPGRVVPVMSVNPYRKDALAALERWAAAGGRYVKWLPNAMGIDPADSRIDPYYEKMKALGLVLITHAGEEQAVESESDQAFGNPLRLRRALDHGVKVIVAHCASLGRDEDLDAPGHPRVPSVELFLRLMDTPKYVGLLFGDISALTQFNRLSRPLQLMLERQDLQPRLVYASDYPLPAINALVRMRPLVSAGLIDPEEADSIAALYKVNPMLFDFVMKRRVKDPKTGKRFADSVFQKNPALP